jgi:Zn-finger protein
MIEYERIDQNLRSVSLTSNYPKSRPRLDEHLAGLRTCTFNALNADAQAMQFCLGLFYPCSSNDKFRRG